MLQGQISTTVPPSGLHRSHFTSCYTLRDSSGTHLPEGDQDIRTAQESLRHKDVKPTMIYTQVLNRRGTGVRRPWTTCKGGLQVYYTETRYQRVPSAPGDLRARNHNGYADVSVGVLRRNVAATGWYRETT